MSRATTCGALAIRLSSALAPLSRRLVVVFSIGILSQVRVFLSRTLHLELLHAHHASTGFAFVASTHHALSPPPGRAEGRRGGGVRARSACPLPSAAWPRMPPSPCVTGRSASWSGPPLTPSWQGAICSTESDCDASVVGARGESSSARPMTCSSRWAPTALPLGATPSWKQPVRSPGSAAWSADKR